MSHIIVASDSFKGSLSSQEVATTISKAILSIHKDAEITELCISDGGEGFAEAVTKAMKGVLVDVNVHDALLRPICAQYGIINGNCAVMDVASTIGLTLLSNEELNPWKASSRGAGEMIHFIVSRGIRKIIIGLGGSATNDCGSGMLDALKNTDKLDECQFIIASDVINPLCGQQGATYVFAPQKGAAANLLSLLETRNMKYGKRLEAQYGKSFIDKPGAGAAGGIGAALMTMNHYRLRNGIDLLLDLYNFDTLLHSASLVITGEGKIDNQSLQGKAPYGIAIRTHKQKIPCYAVCGLLAPDFNHSLSVWDKIIQVSPSNQPLVEVMKPENAKINLFRAVSREL